MHTIAAILTAIVAIEHIFILWMEMFAWETVGKKVFGKALPRELFSPTKKMAANQGLYNGFLVAGLIWSFFIEDQTWSMEIRFFFLSCVAIAGIFGALTASKKIFFLQSVPALLAILFILFSK